MGIKMEYDLKATGVSGLGWADLAQPFTYERDAVGNALIHTPSRTTALAIRDAIQALPGAAVDVFESPPWDGEDEHYCGMDGLDDFRVDSEGVYTPTDAWIARWKGWQAERH